MDCQSSGVEELASRAVAEGSDCADLYAFAYPGCFVRVTLSVLCFGFSPVDDDCNLDSEKDSSACRGYGYAIFAASCLSF